MEDKVYTEGLCGDGAAILENGQPITISEVLKRLNKIEEVRETLNNWGGIRKKLSYTEMIDCLLDTLRRAIK